MEWPEAICDHVVSTVLEAPGPAAWSQVRSRGWGLLTEPRASSRAHPTFPDAAKPGLSASPKMRGKVSSGISLVLVRRELCKLDLRAVERHTLEGHLDAILW